MPITPCRMASVMMAFMRSSSSASGARFTFPSTALRACTDKDAHREYVTRLERGSSSGQDNQELLEIMRAESLFRDAEASVKRRDYVGAADQLRQALGMNPNEGEFHALMGWCHFLRNHPSQEETAKAVDSLQRAIQLAPSSATGYYYMAKLHKACDRGTEAQKMFRKVLEIDPRHQEAMREVRLASMRKDTKGAGLFGFKRKK